MVLSHCVISLSHCRNWKKSFAFLIVQSKLFFLHEHLPAFPYFYISLWRGTFFICQNDSFNISFNPKRFSTVNDKAITTVKCKLTMNEQRVSVHLFTHSNHIKSWTSIVRKFCWDKNFLDFRYCQALHLKLLPLVY